MTTRVDIAWAAGFFEGEGCIYWHTKTVTFGQPALQVRTTDPDVLRRFQRIVECGRVQSRSYDQPSNATKRVYKWAIQDQANVRRVLTMLLPHLGKRRTKKAKEVLSLMGRRQ